MARTPATFQSPEEAGSVPSYLDRCVSKALRFNPLKKRGQSQAEHFGSEMDQKSFNPLKKRGQSQEVGTLQHIRRQGFNPLKKRGQSQVGAA
jgi:hypothetical protein